MLEQTDNYDSSVTSPYTTDPSLQYKIVYAYDNNGSLTDQTKMQNGVTTDTKYGYDARNRMIRVDPNGDTVYDANGNPISGSSDDTIYRYDDSGVRIAEFGPGVHDYYLNDPQNPTGYTKAVEESANLNGPPSRSFLFGDVVIAQSDSTNGVVYLMHDGHGSTRALLDSTGNYVVNGYDYTNNTPINERYDFAAFGGLLASVGGQSDASKAQTPWLFAGDGLYDLSSGWTYHLARWRDGFHFTSEDPSLRSASDPLLAGGYLYGSADAVGYVDPAGHFTLIEMLVVVGLIALVAAFVLPMIFHGHQAAGGVQLMSDLQQAFGNDDVVTQDANRLPSVESPDSALFNVGDAKLVNQLHRRHAQRRSQQHHRRADVHLGPDDGGPSGSIPDS